MKNQIAAILLSATLSISALPQAIVADEPPKTRKQQILSKWKLMFSEKGEKKRTFSDGQVTYTFAKESVVIVGKVDRQEESVESGGTSVVDPTDNPATIEFSGDGGMKSVAIVQMKDGRLMACENTTRPPTDRGLPIRMGKSDR